jgi:tRNA (guanine-N7-)-methyltransferase
MKQHPYAERAPRLPDGERLHPGALLAGASGPVELEIGPGRGGFLFERLATDPSLGMIGFEIRLKWAALVDEKLRAQGLGERGRVFAEDARRAVARLEGGSIATVYLHFPDPWWKKRHHKRIVLSEPLLSEIARVLRPGGNLFIQTDVEERAALYESLLFGRPEFTHPGTSPRLEHNPFAARSPREHRAIADGLPIYRLCYVRR